MLIKATFIWIWTAELSMASNDNKCDVCVCVCVGVYKHFWKFTAVCLWKNTLFTNLICKNAKNINTGA